ncbi:LTA synthase family protein [Thermincola ferriacetica]
MMKQFSVHIVPYLITVLSLTAKFLYLNWVTGSYVNIPWTISLGTLLMLTAPCVALNSGKRLWVLIVFDLIISFLLFADILYYRYYGDIISAPVLVQIGLVGPVLSSVIGLIKFSDLLLVVDLAIFLPFFGLISTGADNKSCRDICMRTVAAVAVMSIGYSVIFFSGNKFDANNRLQVINRAGLLYYHFADISNYLDGVVLGEEPMQKGDMAMIEKRFAGRKMTEGRLTGYAKGANVLVLQVEALQSIVLNLNINGQEITPNLNKLMKESLYFPNFYSQTAQGNTSDAEFLANVSLYPLQKGSVYFLYTKNDYRSLPQVLREMGYSTLVMHANEPEYWNRKYMYPSLHFATFYSGESYLLDEKIGLGLGDRSFLHQSVEKIKQARQPFYSYLITLTSHFPYNFPDKLKVLNLSPYEGTMAANYLHAIHYVDQAIGSFLAEMREQGLLDKTLVVIFGDHFALPENELARFGKLLDVKQDWLVEKNRVPLIIRVPGGKQAGVINTPGGEIDIFPTLANLLNLNPGDLLTMGRDLVNAREGFVVFRDGSYIDKTNNYHNIAKEPQTPEAALALQELRISDLLIRYNLTDRLLNKKGIRPSNR